MPFTQYVCPTFSEDFPASDGLRTVLERSSFTPLRELKEEGFESVLEGLIRYIDDQALPLALVDGALENTPCTKFNAFDEDSPFVVTHHRVLTILPALEEVVPATALCQIIFHARKYLGDTIPDADSQLSLIRGSDQYFLYVYFSEHFGFSSVERDDSISVELGVAVGSLPTAPNGVATKILIDAISKVGNYCQGLKFPVAKDPRLKGSTARLYTVEDSAHSDWDDDQLKDFVRMKALRFIDCKSKQREKLLRFSDKVAAEARESI
jgi:hypothetical protein